MRYYRVNSAQDAMAMSEKLYSIMNPGSVESKYLFGWRSNENMTVIEIDETMVCPVFVTENFAQVLSDIATILNGALSEEQGNSFKEYLQTGHVVLGNLIPYLQDK